MKDGEEDEVMKKEEENEEKEVMFKDMVKEIEGYDFGEEKNEKKIKWEVLRFKGWKNDEEWKEEWGWRLNGKREFREKCEKRFWLVVIENDKIGMKESERMKREL